MVSERLPATITAGNPACWQKSVSTAQGSVHLAAQERFRRGAHKAIRNAPALEEQQGGDALYLVAHRRLRVAATS